MIPEGEKGLNPINNYWSMQVVPDDNDADVAPHRKN